MAVSGDFYTPAGTSTKGGASLVNQVWQPDLERSLYENAEFWPLLVERDRPYNKLNIRKFGRFVATNSLASTASADDGSGLTYVVAADSNITLSPINRYVAVAIARHQISQMNVDPRGPFRISVEQALNEQIDAVCLQDATSLTTNTTGSGSVGLDRPLLLNILEKLRSSARSAITLGETKLWLIIHPAQFGDLMTIPEITAANLRGDSADPLVKGMVLNGLGLNYKVSGNVYTDANGAYNVLFVPEAFGIGWNEKPVVMAQEFELQYRLIAYANFGHNIVWDDRAALIQTNSVVGA